METGLIYKDKMKSKFTYTRIDFIIYILEFMFDKKFIKLPEN